MPSIRRTPTFIDKMRVKQGETNLMHDLENDVLFTKVEQDKKIEQELRDRLAHCADRVPASLASSSWQKAVLWKELAISAIKMSKSKKLNVQAARELLSRLSTEF